MEIDISAWPELLFKFGPYAILALFVLWVTPRASKRMQNITKTAPKAVRVSATITLVASWGVVLVMVAYVLFQWSPVRVYDGSLGVLKQSEQVYPLDDDVYVKMEGTQAPNREKWRFVMVDNERNLNQDGVIHFTYYWGKKDNQYTDYVIPVKTILEVKNNDYSLTKKDPEAEYTWKNGIWTLAESGPKSKPVAFNWHWEAYADDKLNRIANRLASKNRIVRADARMAMRELTTRELHQLKGMTDNKSALHQIDLELRNRHH